MQHVVAAVTPETRDDVGVEVVLRVAHVQITRRIREHREHVLARTRVVVATRTERVGLGPAPLPLGLDRVRVVGVGGHGIGRGGLGHGRTNLKRARG